MNQPEIVNLVSLARTSAEFPTAAPVIDTAGDVFFSSAFEGGPNPVGGAILELDAATGQLVTLADIGVNALALDPAGDLFGEILGPDNVSTQMVTVVEVPHGGGGLTTLATVPASSDWLVTDAAGDVFGSSAAGIFEIAAGQHEATTFAYGPSYGRAAVYAPTFDAQGDLFGTAGYGANAEPGPETGPVYYEVTAGQRSGHNITAIADYSMYSPLVSDASGNLFGMGYMLASGSAASEPISIFESLAGSHKEVTLANVDIYGRSGPFGLLLDAAGDLFGCYIGGYTGADGSSLVPGGVFELKAGSHTVTTVATLGAGDGYGPVYGLVADADGNLYGLSSQGGAENQGVLFEVEDSGFVTGHPYVPPPPRPHNATRVVLSGYANVVAAPFSSIGNGQTGPTVQGPASGGTAVFGTAASETIQAFGLGDTIFADGGDDTILAGAGRATVDVSDADGANVVSGGLGGSTVTLGNGANDISLGGEENRITVGDGANIVTAEAGTATITAGSGANRITLDGHHDVVTGGDGNDVVNGAGGHDAITLGNGRDNVTEGGYGNAITVGTGADSIKAGAGADTVTAGGGADAITLAGYGNTVTTSGGNDRVLGSASFGGNTVSLGDGNDAVLLGGAGNSVRVGAGSHTVVAGSGGDTVVAGTGHTTVMLAGSGNSVTLGGGYNAVTSVGEDDVIRLSGGFDSLTVGGAGDTVFLGGASASVTDVASSLTLDLDGGGGATFHGFAAAAGSVLDLIGSPYATVGALMRNLVSDRHGGSALLLGSRSPIEFAGVPPGAFTAANFKIG